MILYFLKLKRPRMEISSLVLWQQVINDQRVNSPFQKFKRNLLLLLQFLLLTALILAAMQPFLRSGVERAEFLPVLIDCSASMAAVDKPGGTPRIEVVKQRVKEMIDNLLPDQQLSLIAVSSTARRLTSFTDNQRLLSDALRRVEVLDVPSELEDALRMTQALTRTVPIESVLVYSDGNLPPTVDFELPFQINYQQVPPGGANIGITALNARRAPAGQWNVFVRLEASAQGAAAAKVELRQDDQLVAEDYANLEAGASERLVFRIDAEDASRVEVRLTPDGADSLAADNVAVVQLPRPRPLAVYCPVTLESFRHALEALADVDIYPSSEGAAGRSQFDLLIADGPVSEGYDAKVRLLVGFVPPDLEKLATINAGLAEIVDWQRNSPLLQHVQLGQVVISDEPSSMPGIQDGDYESLGYEILAYSRKAPLILKKRSDAEVAYHLLFHPDRSTLPYRVGFPILVSNIVELAMREADLSEVRGVSTGVLPAVRLAPDSEYAAVSPNGQTRQVTSNPGGLVTGVAAPTVGRYTFRKGSDVTHVDASLLSAQETSLRSVDEIKFDEVSVGAATEQIRNDRPLWPYFAMSGFGLLLVEWWFFNRRSMAT